MPNSKDLNVPRGRDAAAPTRGLTVVVPCYHSEETLPFLLKELEPVLPRVRKYYEVILVNDGSTDGTWDTICALAGQYPFVRGINMMRNYGQHNATLCGIRAARYDVLVTMDDDLQNPPEDIPAMVAHLEQGYDLVYGVPRKMAHSAWRNFLSVATKYAVALAAEHRNVQELSAFRAFRTRLRDAFTGYRSPQLILDVLLAWGTTRVGSIEANWKPREHGTSNYNVFRLINQAMLLWTGYTTAPLRFATMVGFLFVVTGLGLLVYVLGRYMLVGSLPGFPFLATTVVVFGGMQLFALGVVGEYIARMFNRSLDRPTYIVAESTQAAQDPSSTDTGAGATLASADTASS